MLHFGLPHTFNAFTDGAVLEIKICYFPVPSWVCVTMGWFPRSLCNKHSIALCSTEEEHAPTAMGEMKRAVWVWDVFSIYSADVFSSSHEVFRSWKHLCGLKIHWFYSTKWHISPPCEWRTYRKHFEFFCLIFSLNREYVNR